MLQVVVLVYWTKMSGTLFRGFSDFKIFSLRKDPNNRFASKKPQKHKQKGPKRTTVQTHRWLNLFLIEGIVENKKKEKKRKKIPSLSTGFFETLFNFTLQRHKSVLLNRKSHLSIKIETRWEFCTKFLNLNFIFWLH